MSSNADLLFKVAVAQEENSPAKALQLYQQLLEAAPWYAEAHINMGTIFYKQRHWEKARQAYMQAIACAPRYALAYFNLGNVLGELGQHEEAMTAYRKALVLDPLYGDAHYNLAVALQAKGKPRLALQHWQRYAKLDPSGEWHDHAAAQAKLTLLADPIKLLRSNPDPVRTPARAALALVKKEAAPAAGSFYRPSRFSGDDGPGAA